MLKINVNGPTIQVAWVFPEKIIESIVHHVGAGKTMEQVTAGKIPDGYVPQKFVFLREIATSISRTFLPKQGNSIVIRRFEGPIIVEEGVVQDKDILTIRTNKGAYTFAQIEDIFMAGWRF